MHYTAKFRRRLSPKGAGQHLCLRLRGFWGMLWGIFPCLHSMFLCRRWWISCRTLSSSFVCSHLILSRLSKYPRSFRCPHARGRAGAAAGGTAGGSADDHILFLVTADCGALRRHSSSWWWRTKFWSSRFSPKTAFNRVAFQKTHF